MERVKSISRVPTVKRYSEAVGLLEKPGDTVIVTRGVPRSVVMKCPEGCGDLITLNLDRRSGPAWRVYERRGRLTIFPSVWRANGCEAHFIVWNDRVIWCDASEAGSWEDPNLLYSIEQILPPATEPHRHYEDLAGQLGGVVPWDVLWACQALVRKGVAASSERGTKFGAASKPRPSSGRVDTTA